MYAKPCNIIKLCVVPEIILICLFDIVISAESNFRSICEICILDRDICWNVTYTVSRAKSGN